MSSAAVINLVVDDLFRRYLFFDRNSRKIDEIQNKHFTWRFRAVLLLEWKYSNCSSYWANRSIRILSLSHLKQYVLNFIIRQKQHNFGIPHVIIIIIILFEVRPQAITFLLITMLWPAWQISRQSTNIRSHPAKNIIQHIWLFRCIVDSLMIA